ncbi:MAG: hypothetical protein ABW133_22390 [Polyangiaceae bacterium]
MTAARKTAWIAVPATVLALALVAAGFRLTSEANSDLAASDDAWRKGDVATATVRARSAARAYVPGQGHMERGYARLREIAESSERRGDNGAALFAWRAVLSSAIGSRPFSTCGETCDVARTAIARLSVAEGKGRVTSGDRRGIAVERAASDVVPPAYWGVIIVLAAALLLAAGQRLHRAFGRGGVILRGEVRSAAVIGAAGFALWMLGMLFA